MDLSNLPIRVRPAVQGDVNFIFNSWLESFRRSLFPKNIINEVYYSEHHKVIENLLKTATTLILCNEADSAEIYGYICAERVQGIFVLHYVYIKHTYRKLGLGKLLLNQFDHDTSNAAICTHMTKIAERLSTKYSLVHNPYVALTGEYEAERVKELAQQQKAETKEALNVQK